MVCCIPFMLLFCKFMSTKWCWLYDIFYICISPMLYNSTSGECQMSSEVRLKVNLCKFIWAKNVFGENYTEFNPCLDRFFLQY